MADEVLTELLAGDLLAGKYRIERVLGRGGMGVVVAAVHEVLDERVAIKFLLPEVFGNREAVERFLREARSAVKIKSEHVARVTDVGTLESGSPYMVMEYLEGMDLSRYVEIRGALPVDEVIEYVLQTCEALAVAHSLGIVHRDLKPANLFRSERPDGTPSIKLLDFGISKIATQDVSMTRTSTMMGSPLYMAPEQMTSAKHVDVRADVWALGIILHELLSGEVPFVADTIPELCAKILTETPPPIRQIRPEVPAHLETVVTRCLKKNRDERYGSVAELAEALRPIAPVRALISVERVIRVLGAPPVPQTLVPEVTPEAQATDTGSRASNAKAATQAAWGKTEVPLSPPPLKKLPRSLALGGALLFVIVGLAVTWAVSGREPTTEGPGADAASLPSAAAIDSPVAPAAQVRPLDHVEEPPTKEVAPAEVKPSLGAALPPSELPPSELPPSELPPSEPTSIEAGSSSKPSSAKSSRPAPSAPSTAGQTSRSPVSNAPTGSTASEKPKASPSSSDLYFNRK